VNSRSRHMKRADLDRVFLLVDGMATAAAAGSARKDFGLGRPERYHCLV